MRRRGNVTLAVTLIALACVSSTPVIASFPPRQHSTASPAAASPLGAIALTLHELPHGFHLAGRVRDTAPVRGFQTGTTWTYLHARRVTSPGLFKIVNTVFRYDTAKDAANGMAFTSARACSSHEQTFGYHGITAAIGDFNVACYYPVTVQHVPNVRVIAMALRRFTYVTVIRVYATPITAEATLEGKVAHWAALVDRRIELAVHPSVATKSGRKTPTGTYLHILRCTQPRCLWKAQGRGNTLYRSTFRSMPRSWTFTPPPLFLVAFKFDCGPVTGQTYSFLLYEVDDVGERVALREYADQRNVGQVAGGLPAGGKRVALQILVQNNSCTWSVTARRVTG